MPRSMNVTCGSPAARLQWILRVRAVGSGRLCDGRVREIVDLPMVGHPTRLWIRLPRFAYPDTECGTKIFQQQLACAKPKAKLTARCIRWILQRLAIDFGGYHRDFDVPGRQVGAGANNSQSTLLVNWSTPTPPIWPGCVSWGR